MRFVYSVIRYVPDTARGEFVNVGAIVGNEETAEWRVRQISNPTRARQFDDRAALEAAWSFIDRIGREIDRFEQANESLFDPEVELDERWLARLHKRHRNLVQLSPPTPVVAETADEAMDRVFGQLVLDPEGRHFDFDKKQAAQAALRAAYRNESLSSKHGVRERVRLVSPSHRSRFDFAVTNGKAVQLAQAWSFQIPDQEQLSQQVRAWGWAVQDVIDHGGHLELPDEATLEVANTVDIEVVYVPPRAGQDAPALDDARKVFGRLGINAVPLDGAATIAQRARTLLDAAHGSTLNHS